MWRVLIELKPLSHVEIKLGQGIFWLFLSSKGSFPPILLIINYFSPKLFLYQVLILGQADNFASCPSCLYLVFENIFAEKDFFTNFTRLFLLVCSHKPTSFDMISWPSCSFHFSLNYNTSYVLPNGIFEILKENAQFRYFF